MKNLFAYLILLSGVSAQAFASVTLPAPEINASTAIGAIGLVSGALLILRSRRK